MFVHYLQSNQQTNYACRILYINNTGHGFESHHLHHVICLTINHKYIRRGPIKRTFVQKVQREKINEQIRADKIRVIDEIGTQLGIMSPSEALEMARDREMDLVEVSPLATPPVCRIMDYGKFQYQHAKSTKVKAKKIDVKELRIGFRTDIHDLEVRRNQVVKFLEKGNKVKIEIRLKGREKMHKDKARENLASFIKSIPFEYKIEQEIKSFPGGFNVVLMP